jgi:hypothetical protein
MKTRVTFRVSPDLADALRELPNQTAFVERALRQALQRPCPVCAGTGHVAGELAISDFREAKLPRIGRSAALQLKGIVALAKRSGATRLELTDAGGGSLGFHVAQREAVLLKGTLQPQSTTLMPS